jgi:hypothetical protein
MPTHREQEQILREFAKLTEAQQDQFAVAMKHMVEDLRAKRPFRASLRVKGVQGHPGIFEMTWNKTDGRATFSFGSEVIPGEPHIIWRRIGRDEIFGNP